MTWILVAFISGWLACWYLSSFLLKRVFRKGDSMMVAALKNLPQTSLVRIFKAAGDEIAERKKEID